MGGWEGGCLHHYMSQIVCMYNLIIMCVGRCGNTGMFEHCCMSCILYDFVVAYTSYCAASSQFVNGEEWV